MRYREDSTQALSVLIGLVQSLYAHRSVALWCLRDSELSQISCTCIVYTLLNPARVLHGSITDEENPTP